MRPASRCASYSTPCPSSAPVAHMAPMWSLTLTPMGDSACVGRTFVEHLMPDIRSLGPALLQVLQPSTVPMKLNPNTLAEHLNGEFAHSRNYEALKIGRCVRMAVFEFMQQIVSGKIRARLRRVRNRPVTDWIDIDTLARLLQEGPRL